MVQIDVVSALSNVTFTHVRMNASALFSDPAAGELIASPIVFVQVFGDYYHFRHHAVEKRALSDHKGMHIRLLKEPQVRLLSALTQLSAATKGQKTDWIRHRGCVYHRRRRCQHQ